MGKEESQGGNLPAHVLDFLTTKDSGHFKLTTPGQGVANACVKQPRRVAARGRCGRSSAAPESSENQSDSQTKASRQRTPFEQLQSEISCPVEGRRCVEQQTRLSDSQVKAREGTPFELLQSAVSSSPVHGQSGRIVIRSSSGEKPLELIVGTQTLEGQICKTAEPAPPVLRYQTANIQAASHPGAFSIAGLCDDNEEIVSFDHNDASTAATRRDDNNNNNIIHTGIIAELVEDSEQAAQKEIDRLKQELEGLKRQQQQMVVLAEPLREDNRATLTPSHPATAVMTTKATETSKKLGYLTTNGPTHNAPEDNPNHQLSNGISTSSIGLVGRDKEINLLHQCLERATKGAKKQFLTISGHSGCGKTALASSLEHTIQEDKGLFVSGKFDLYLRDQPYFGIAAACKQICPAIHKLRTCRSCKRSFQELHGLLSSALSPQDIQALVPVIPDLQDVMDMSHSKAKLRSSKTSLRFLRASGTNKTAAGGRKGQENKNRLHFAFRLFLRVISNYFAPFVMVLDDLQWADAASLELMQDILMDQDNPSLLMIGLYRSNEVQGDAALESLLLNTVLRELAEKREEGNLEISEVVIGNLGQEAVQSVVMGLLSFKECSDQVMELASLCFQRTHGNAYFVISFVSMLAEEGFLWSNGRPNEFTWDIERIKSETNATSNLVEMMKAKMAKLPGQLSQLLSVAACLGSSFQQSNLVSVWSHLCSADESSNKASAREALQVAMKEGFLESLDDEFCQWKWIHDNVQEAALSLIPEEDTSNFKFQIGDALFRDMNSADLEDNVFLVVNLLNEPTTQPLQRTQSLQISELNLLATQEAIARSAYSSAAKYASKGIDFLPVDSWASSHQLTLDLHYSAIESNELVGNHEVMKNHCDEILSQATCSLLDKVRVYNALTARMGSSGKHVEAVELLLDVLGSLGCRFPKTTTSRALANYANLINLKLTAKRRTSDEIDRLPTMLDPTQIETMKLLDKLITYAHMSGSDVCALAISKSTSLTLKHGVCDVSSPAFAFSATILTGALRDLQAGDMLAGYALQLEKAVNAGVSLSRTKMLSGCFAFPWLQPWQRVSSLLLESFSDGMSNGDTESAFFAAVNYICLSGMAGKPLKLLQDDCAAYFKQMKELGRGACVGYTLVLWQAVNNKMAFPQNQALLQGEVLTDLEEFSANHRRNATMMAMITSQQLRLFLLHGEYEQAANLFKAHGYDRIKSSHFIIMDTVFAGGVASFEMARQTGKRKYKKLAMKARSTVKRWARQGNPNVAHYEELMDAELSVLRRKHKAAERHYQSAIAIAFRNGFVHDCALANERYGCFLLSELSNKENAGFYFKEAIRLYSDWGAAGKVELLQEDCYSTTQLGSSQQTHNSIYLAN